MPDIYDSSVFIPSHNSRHQGEAGCRVVLDFSAVRGAVSRERCGCAQVSQTLERQGVAWLQRRPLPLNCLSLSPAPGSLAPPTAAPSTHKHPSPGLEFLEFAMWPPRFLVPRRKNGTLFIFRFIPEPHPNALTRGR